jgi:hypothetical protein
MNKPFAAVFQDTKALPHPVDLNVSSLQNVLPIRLVSNKSALILVQVSVEAMLCAKYTTTVQSATVLTDSKGIHSNTAREYPHPHLNPKYLSQSILVSTTVLVAKTLTAEPLVKLLSAIATKVT